MSAKATLIGALAWALAFLVSAGALKGNPVGDWIEGALIVGWIVFVSLGKPRRYTNAKTDAR